MLGKAIGLGLLVVGLSVACGGESNSDDSGGGGGGSGGVATGGAAGTTSGGSAGVSSGGGGAGGSTTVTGRCGDTPPAGAPMPADPPAYSGGTCPALQAGANTITTAAGDRQFLLALPTNLDPNKKYPVVFLWHWLGGDANGFYEKAEIQAAVDTQGFIAVIPEKKGDLLFVWPVEIIASQARIDEELGFFDDMLACVSQTYSIDTSCVSSAGVSAGALWTPQLASARGDHLSSFISLSGGVGGVIKGWGNPAHKMPAIVLWGGPTDNCAGLLSFEAQSKNLEKALVDNGHFFIECVHNCGHSQPPFEGPAGYSAFKGLWDFVLDHPYWLPPGASPYNDTGIPADMPAWCGIGPDSATPRTGECIDGSQC